MLLFFNKILNENIGMSAGKMGNWDRMLYYRRAFIKIKFWLKELQTWWGSLGQVVNLNRDYRYRNKLLFIRSDGSHSNAYLVTKHDL